jgi:DNA excision repair protein ERCC-4
MEATKADIDTLFDDPVEPIEPVEPVDAKQIFPASVIVDTREQAPFHFTNIEPWSIVPLVHCALPTGDYSLRGFESRVTIERKSISDFIGSITAGRDRFEREFERMAQMEFAAVIVEGELSDVLSHSKQNTRVATDSILGTLDSWRIRYGVHWVFCMGRRHAEINTLTMLYQFWRNEQKRFKSLAKQPAK